MNDQIMQFINSPMVLPWMIPLLIWTMFWKGMAMWHAAQRKSLPWFVILLIVNSFGLLEIGYLIWLKTKGEKIFS